MKYYCSTCDQRFRDLVLHFSDGEIHKVTTDGQ